MRVMFYASVCTQTYFTAFLNGWNDLDKWGIIGSSLTFTASLTEMLSKSNKVEK